MIAHFPGSLMPQNSIDRFLGYKKALEDNNIIYDSSLVYIRDNNTDFEDGYENSQKAIADHSDLDAIFAVTDLVAIWIIKYLNDVNNEIPKKIADFGF